MFRAALIIAIVAAPTFAADDKDKEAKAKQLRGEIAAAKLKVRELEKKLLELEGTPYVGPVKESGVPGARPILSLKDGDKGHFGNYVYRIDQVGSNFLFVSIGGLTFMILEVETKGLAEGTAFNMNGEWKVGTIDWKGRTYFGVTQGKGAEIVPK